MSPTLMIIMGVILFIGFISGSIMNAKNKKNEEEKRKIEEARLAKLEEERLERLKIEEEKRLKKEREEDLKNSFLIPPFLKKIKAFVEEINKLKEFKFYLSFSKINELNLKLDEIEPDLYLLKENKTLKFSEEEAEEYKELIYDSADYWEKINVDKYNVSFVNTEKIRFKKLLSDIDGKSLDEQQRDAVVRNEDSNLVIAGAGSGKTLTISAKVKYLVAKGIKPEEILLFSFSKKSAEELTERIKTKLNLNVQASTFHSFGFNILKNFNDTKKVMELMDVDEVITNKSLSKILENDIEFNKNYLEYILCYSHDNASELDFKNKNEMLKATPTNLIDFGQQVTNKVHNIIQNLKIIYYKKKETLDGFNKKIALKLLGNSQLSDNLYIFLKEYPEEMFIVEDSDWVNIENAVERFDSKDDFENIAERAIKKYCSKSKSIKLDNRKKVRSEEERIISNFLFLNGVRYEYEKLYKDGRFEKPDWQDWIYDENKGKSAKYTSYRPDFYLTDYDIYLEHFGVDEDMQAHQYSEEQNKKYVASMEWKRKVHEINGTTMIETYSWYSQKNILLEKLTEELKKHGVKFREITREELKILTLMLENEEEEEAFVKLVKTFLQLFKSKGLKYDDIEKFEKIAQGKMEYTRKKHLLFFSLFKPILKYYNSIVRDNVIDFNDMINRASDIINVASINELGFHYKYVIVDEFQDTSFARFKLVKSVVDKTKATLMVVGDDWQSIYRFTGSDITLFTKFESYFGKTSLSKIEQTYRNSQQLIDVASDFVLSNPEQLKKDLQSKKEIPQPIKIFYNEFEKVDETVFDILKEIEENLKNGFYKKEEIEVLILARNSVEFNKLNGKLFFMVYSNEFYLTKENLEKIGIDSIEGLSAFKLRDINNSLKSFFKGGIKEKNKGERRLVSSLLNKNIKIKLLTVHGSKGLEADEVIVLGNDDQIVGFPNKIEDDSVLEYVLNEKEKYLFSEERRLFYVAITRTKNRTYLIADKYHPSTFVNELIGYKTTNVFVDELNSVFNQEYTCKNCGGALVERRNKKDDSRFLGCVHYPICEYTEKVPEEKKASSIMGYVNFLRKSRGLEYNDYYEKVDRVVEKYIKFSEEEKRKIRQTFLLDAVAAVSFIFGGDLGFIAADQLTKFATSARNNIKLQENKNVKLKKEKLKDMLSTYAVTNMSEDRMEEIATNFVKLDKEGFFDEKI